MKILAVTANYPSEVRPHYGTFVQQFVRAMQGRGAECRVVYPVSLFDRRHGPLPVLRPEPEDGIPVLRPRHLSFSVKQVGPWNTAWLTQHSFERAAARGLRMHEWEPDLFYGHFLYQAGRTAVKLAARHRKPSFVNVGEGTLWTIDPMGEHVARRHYQNVTGAIAVNTPIREDLMRRVGIPEHKITVIPNGVDLDFFSRKDRDEMCRKHGLPTDTVNIVFVGAFDELKGPARLVEAAGDLERVRLIFIGAGEVPLDAPNIVLKRPVPHAHIPELLSASDLFVLPTIEEGSCNAIIEAMAVGLPVISSNARFNDDILDEHTALRVDTHSPAEIRAAILALLENEEKRKELARNAWTRARDFDIRRRADRVLGWMRSRMEEEGFVPTPDRKG